MRHLIKRLYENYRRLNLLFQMIKNKILAISFDPALDL